MRNVYPLIFNLVSEKALMHKCLTDMTEKGKRIMIVTKARNYK